MDALKEKKPVPFGIKVTQDIHSSTNLHAEQPKEDNRAATASPSDLQPLKEKAPVPFGIKITNVQHSMTNLHDA